jgi:hypothetical protein
MSAIATTEHMIKGQMGQPAACMMENNPVLSMPEQGRNLLHGIMGPAEVHLGGRARSSTPVVVVQAAVSSMPRQFTAAVDNFVGKPAPSARKPRKIKASNRLLNL